MDSCATCGFAVSADCTFDDYEVVYCALYEGLFDGNEPACVDFEDEEFGIINE